MREKEVVVLIQYLYQYYDLDWKPLYDEGKILRADRRERNEKRNDLQTEPKQIGSFFTE